MVHGPTIKWLYPKLLMKKYLKVLKRLYLNKTFIPSNISATIVTFVLKYILCLIPLQIFTILSYTRQDTTYKYD